MLTSMRFRSPTGRRAVKYARTGGATILAFGVVGQVPSRDLIAVAADERSCFTGKLVCRVSSSTSVDDLLPCFAKLASTRW
jgi:hypothetical protein